MNKADTKIYWSLKNRIGYCVLTGNNAKRKVLEQVLSNLMKKAGK